MRKYYLTIIIFLSLTLQIFSQSSFLDLYPLHIGNYWQYKVTVDSDFNNEDTIYYSNREVLTDTLMPNGEVYKKIFDSMIGTLQPYRYLRIDSTTGCIYKYYPYGNYNNSELLRDSLKMMSGDSFIAEDGYTIICTLVDTINLFAENRLRKHFYYPLLPNYGEHKYVKGIGETYRWVHSEPIVAIETYIELTYAKINGEEFGQLVSVGNNTIKIFNYTLSQNYPNPFNPTTTIKYQIPELSFVTLKVYDVLGNEVASLIKEEKPAGSYEVEFNGSDLTSGIYFYTLIAGNYSNTKKLVILKWKEVLWKLYFISQPSL